MIGGVVKNVFGDTGQRVMLIHIDKKPDDMAFLTFCKVSQHLILPCSDEIRVGDRVELKAHKIFE